MIIIKDPQILNVEQDLKSFYRDGQCESTEGLRVTPFQLLVPHAVLLGKSG